MVHEHNGDVGGRFHGDFQGLENWTVDDDVLDELGRSGIEATFEHAAYREFTVFDADGRALSLRSSRPLFYLVRRGSQPGTLDASLKDTGARGWRRDSFQRPVPSSAKRRDRRRRSSRFGRNRGRSCV